MCEYGECRKHALFNFAGEIKPAYCGAHYKDGMKDIVHKKCEYKNCETIPVYNFAGEIAGIYCYEHRDPVMINVRNKKCAHSEGCPKSALFNTPDKTVGLYCKEHITDKLMVNVISNQCIDSKCRVRPLFNEIGTNYGISCKKHSPESYVDVVSRSCAFKGCRVSPNFNLPSIKVAKYCATHSSPEMVNVIIRRCLDCNLSPSFNYVGEKRGIYCAEHSKKHIGMVNITRRTCDHSCDGEKCPKTASYKLLEGTEKYCRIHKNDEMVRFAKVKVCAKEDCMIRPYYNFKPLKTGLYCKEHADDGMQDVINKTCVIDKCDIIARFNDFDKKTALFCKFHSTPLMCDVLNRRFCSCKDCKTIPTFGEPDEVKALFCAKHKTKTMISIRNKVCQDKDCKLPSTHGLYKKRPQFCEGHALPDMINLYDVKKCSECEKPYDFALNGVKYCLAHHPNKHIEAYLLRQCKFCDMVETEYVCKDCNEMRHKKEWLVITQLRKNVKREFIVDSSQMLNGLSRRRPDVYFQMTNHCVIIEVDEHQHRNYSDICECARICEITGSIGKKALVFIRYNPDIIRNCGKKIIIDTDERINTLIKTVRRELDADYKGFFVKIIQLYYDDDYETYEVMKTEDITGRVAL
jgi:hypothetical protein